MILWAAAAVESTPTWLAVVGAVGVGTVLSSAITAGSLMLQNRWNAEREDKRRADDALERQRDRDHQIEELRVAAELNRRHEVEAHYRQERHAAHADALGGLLNALEKLRSNIHLSQRLFEVGDLVEIMSSESPLDQDDLRILESRLLALRLMGSQNAAELLETAIRYLKTFESALAHEKGEWSNGSVDRLLGFWRDGRSAAESYEHGARSDIGLT